MLNEKQQKELEELAKPLVKFLNTLHPHTHITIDHTHVQLWEGAVGIKIDEYVND